MTWSGWRPTTVSNRIDQLTTSQPRWWSTTHTVNAALLKPSNYVETGLSKPSNDLGIVADSKIWFSIESQESQRKKYNWLFIWFRLCYTSCFACVVPHNIVPIKMQTLQYDSYVGNHEYCHLQAVINCKRHHLERLSKVITFSKRKMLQQICQCLHDVFLL